MQHRRYSRSKVLLISLLAACVVVRLAHGYGWCSEYWNWDGRRKNPRDGRRWPAGDGVVITYINGIFHSVSEWETITGNLQAHFGHEVRPFYNPSSGWWITDASKAGYHLLRKPVNDTIAHALGEHLAQAVGDVGRGRVLHIAHSGGALITYLAAQNHLTRRQRDKIDVLTFGGARSITRKYFSGRVVNYYARNDPLVKLDRRAAELMKRTSNSTVQAVNDKHNTTFIFLEGRARQFVLDHSLEGPTYQHALRREARAFRRSHFGPLSPLSWDYDTSLLRLVRKKVAQVSGMHRFFSAENLGLHSMRKAAARMTGMSGYFSGKTPDVKAVIVRVPQPQEERPSLAQRLSRPWWKGNDKDAAEAKGQAVTVREDAAAKSSEQTDRKWFIGWRWYPGKKNDEPGEGEASVGYDGTGQAEGRQARESSEGEVSISGRLWNIWGSRGRSGPRQSVTDDTSQSEDDELSDSEDDANAVERAKEVGSASNAGKETSPSVSSTPWLSLGWTPWGAARAPSDNAVKDDSAAIETLRQSEGNVAENSDGLKADERPSSVDDALLRGKEEPALENDRGTEEEDKLFGLKRWWPIGSSQREAVDDAGGVVDQADAGALDGKDTSRDEGGDEKCIDGPGSDAGRAVFVQDDRSSNSTAMDDISKQKAQSMLRRWWPMSKNDELPAAPTVVGAVARSDGGRTVGEGDSQISAPIQRNEHSVSIRGRTEEKLIDDDVEEQQPAPTTTPAQSSAGWRFWPDFMNMIRTNEEPKSDSVPPVGAVREQSAAVEPPSESDRSTEDGWEKVDDASPEHAAEEELLSAEVLVWEQVSEAFGGQRAGDGGDGDGDGDGGCSGLVDVDCQVGELDGSADEEKVEGPSTPPIVSTEVSSFDTTYNGETNDCGNATSEGQEIGASMRDRSSFTVRGELAAVDGAARVGIVSETEDNGVVVEEDGDSAGGVSRRDEDDVATSGLDGGVIAVQRETSSVSRESRKAQGNATEDRDGR